LDKYEDEQEAAYSKAFSSPRKEFGALISVSMEVQAVNGWIG